MTEQRQVIATLLAEIDRYIAALDFAGMADVRAGISRWSGPANQSVVPALLPPCRYLNSALEIVKDRRLADAIAAALPLLKWVSYDAYPRADVGEAFAEGHAFASVIGEEGFHAAEDFDLGLFIIEPNVDYPDRHHAAPELYAPLTGPHGWRFLPAQAYQWINADIPVWNEAWAPHATKTGDLPFLCIYCWTKDVNLPAKIIFPHEASKDQK